jgi:flavin-dependent dehydrogenase
MRATTTEVVGDAAHATSPSSGQGASMAIEAGVVLAECLRDLPDARMPSSPLSSSAGRGLSASLHSGPPSSLLNRCALAELVQRPKLVFQRIRSAVDLMSNDVRGNPLRPAEQPVLEQVLEAPRLPFNPLERIRHFHRQPILGVARAQLGACTFEHGLRSSFG